MIFAILPKSGEFFEVKVLHFRVRGANSHTPKFQDVRNFKFAPKSRFSEFSRSLHNKCDCLHLLHENVSLSLQKLPGFEEISSSRWSQYILKCFNSSSMKSYRPLKLGVSFWINFVFFHSRLASAGE